jgi:hypothetical protein
VLLVCLSVVAPAQAASEATATADATGPVEKRDSPWLLVPMVSSDPKLGTSLGALVAYLHKFDPVSSASMFGTGGTYTSTHSKIGALFAHLFWPGPSSPDGVRRGGESTTTEDSFGLIPLSSRITKGAVRYPQRQLRQLVIGAQVVSTTIRSSRPTPGAGF